MPSHLKIGFLQSHYYAGINTLHPLLKKLRYQDFKILSTKTLRNINYRYLRIFFYLPYLSVYKGRSVTQNATSKVLSARLRRPNYFFWYLQWFYFFLCRKSLFLSTRRQDTISLLPNARAFAIFSNVLFSH